MPAAGDASRPRRAWSLEWRLPLLMSGVLAVVLAAALAITYATLARSATAGAEERLRRASKEIATVAETGIRLGRARYRAVAADSAVRRALRGRAGGAGAIGARADRPVAGRTTTDSLVHAALGRLVAPTDSGLPVELWTAEGERVAFVGTDLRASVRTRTGESELADSVAHPFPIPREGLDALAGRAARRDSLQLGALYASNGRVYYWVVAPVLERGVPVGYLAQQRRIAANGRTDETIRELAGDSVTAYYRNLDGGFWSTLSGHPTTGPRRDSTSSGAGRGGWVRPDVGPILSAEARVTGTPLVIVFELARRRVLARPRSTVLTLAAVSLALLAVGAAITWGVSRRITRPIVSLTAAAESLARGDYHARARASGDDEIARLAVSFNHMAEEISATRAALERESSDARTAAAALAHTNAELVQAREVAETASRAKSAFLATMSHELRTPLNAIGGYAELMALGIRGPVTDEQRRDLERIRVSQQHLLGLVSAILDLSRIERGDVSYRLAPVALGPVLAELDALVGPQAAANGLTLEYAPCAEGLAVTADREKLRQILLNLLSNAIRFTPPGGAVVVMARARDETTVEISVRDTGVGIPEDRQAQIFEPFVQLDRSLSNIREGIGLGLSISRDLARGMGGDLTVESRVERGSCFALTLPRPADDASELVPVGDAESRVERPVVAADA